MGMFSHDEEPSWSEVVSLQKQIRALNDNYRDLQAENERLQTTIYKLENKKDAMCKQNKELTEVNAQLQAYKDVNEDFKKAWEELKAENERLKAKVIRLEDFIKSASDIDKINLFYVNKLETCLQEIKGITEAVECPCEYRGDDCYECDLSGAKRLADKILQKIAEVENG